MSFRWRRWLPAALTLLVVLTAFARQPPLVDAVSLGPAAGAHLVLPFGYLLLAPLDGLYDQLSLLSKDQHIAVLATLVLAFIAWRLLPRPRHRRGFLRAAGSEVAAAIVALAGLVAFYAVGVLAPRPMASLRLSDPAELAVDLHSHTSASHDGRARFTPQRNRSWHDEAGFDAAFITDHHTWAGWEEARSAEPDSAGAGTLLLPGLEAVFRNEHAVALGPPALYRGALLGPTLSYDTLRMLDRPTAPPPILVLTLPAGLDAIHAATPADRAGYVAIEVSDASPRGLQQSDDDHARLLRLADSLDLAVVAGSNNHGWGRTAAAWTVLRVPGWRRMGVDTLTARIDRLLATERRAAARVVARRAVHTDGSVSRLALTLPAVGWALLRQLSLAERLAWIAWIWILAALIVRRAPRDRRSPRA